MSALSTTTCLSSFSSAVSAMVKSVPATKNTVREAQEQADSKVLCLEPNEHFIRSRFECGAVGNPTKLAHIRSSSIRLHRFRSSNLSVDSAIY